MFLWHFINTVAPNFYQREGESSLLILNLLLIKTIMVYGFLVEVGGLIGEDSSFGCCQLLFFSQSVWRFSALRWSFLVGLTINCYLSTISRCQLASHCSSKFYFFFFSFSVQIWNFTLPVLIFSIFGILCSLQVKSKVAYHPCKQCKKNYQEEMTRNNQRKSPGGHVRVVW